MTAIMASAVNAEKRLSEPVASITPVQNSIHAKAIQPVSTTSRGKAIPHTVRYSSTLIIKPQGSMAFAQPDTTKVAPAISRASHTAAVYRRDLAAAFILGELYYAEDGIIDDIEVI